VTFSGGFPGNFFVVATNKMLPNIVYIYNQPNFTEMKKAILLSIACSQAFCSYAQTPLPYYTGFETATEKAGWTQYAKGNLTTKTWNVGPSGGVSTSPNVLVSPNAEFNSSALTDTIDQWYVSPGFNFHTGGKIDSFSIFVFGASGSAQPSDSIVLYLLQGSANPSMATSKTRLANLTTMVKGFGGTMKDTGNFIIPPTSGTSYIGFRYYAVYDWFQVYIDSIYISGNSLAGIVDVNTGRASVYPNPANTSIEVSFKDASDATDINIINAIGKTVLTQKTEKAQQHVHIDVSNLPAGLYYVRINAGANVVAQQKFEIANK
jgi:hypothetical protein